MKDWVLINHEGVDAFSNFRSEGYFIEKETLTGDYFIYCRPNFKINVLWNIDRSRWVQLKRCFLKFCKIYRETTELDSLF